MKKIRSVVDVFRYCSPDTVKIVRAKTEIFKTTESSTAIVLQHMGALYYVQCVTPGTTSVEILTAPTDKVTMRSVPKLIQDRLDFLANKKAFSDPASKRVLYLALGATPELQMLNELEGHDHKPLDQLLPWGITKDAQEKVVAVYMEASDRENDRKGSRYESCTNEQPSQPSGRSDDRSVGKRKRDGC
jgi:hypothetical protein|tara:strand:+ start:9184 stop:9747 length:564 start_codon:yes stop_codon:yes gene_type:complete